MEQKHKIDDFILTAYDRRTRCRYCNLAIEKGQKYFRDAMQGYRSSHTVNICQRCLVRIFLLLALEEEDIKTIRKELILESLEDKDERT